MVIEPAGPAESVFLLKSISHYREQAVLKCSGQSIPVNSEESAHLARLCLPRRSDSAQDDSLTESAFTRTRDHASDSGQETTQKSLGNEIAKTIILTCDVARSFPSRVHVTFTLTDVVTQMSGCLLTTSAEKGAAVVSHAREW